MSLDATAPLRRLTQKQEAWINSYVVCNNATKAAIDSGTPEKSAGTVGSQYLQNIAVMARVTELRALASAKTVNRKQRIEEELERLAFYKPELLARVEEDGSIVADASKATADELHAITGISTKRRTLYTPKGEYIGTEVQSSVKLSDKQRALQMLMDIEGMGQKSNQLHVTVDVADRLLRSRQRLPMLTSNETAEDTEG